MSTYIPTAKQCVRCEHVVRWGYVFDTNICSHIFQKAVKKIVHSPYSTRTTCSKRTYKLFFNQDVLNAIRLEKFDRFSEPITFNLSSIGLFTPREERRFVY